MLYEYLELYQPIPLCYIALLGAAVGLVAVGVRKTSQKLIQLKTSLLKSFNTTNLVLYTGLNIVATGCSSLLVNYISPIAAGSGIPEIKYSQNNPIMSDNLFDLKTGFVKIVGIIGTVVGGIAAGFEGPIIHVGAIGGYLISENRRDVIAIGIAAGIASAFKAPLTAAIFGIEEGCIQFKFHYLYTFVFTGIVSVCLMGLITGFQPLFTFDKNTSWHYYELFFFGILGIFGGVLGGLYNFLNGELTKWRLSISHPFLKVLEVCAISVFFTIYQIIVSRYRGHCNEGYIDNSIPLDCKTGYNDLATLLFNNHERSIDLLFSSNSNLSTECLTIFSISFFLFSCVCYGLSVPGGLFVPNLLVGAGFGRLVGQLLHTNIKSIQPSLYALVGAGAFLSGILRINITILLILVETTGVGNVIIPLIVGVIVSKAVADYFDKRGLYDVHNDLKIDSG